MRSVRLKLACADFTFPLLLHDGALELIGLLDFDGVDIGQTTPLLSWPLRKGSHRIRLVAAGRSKELAVEIRTGETHSEIVDLQAAPQKRGRR